METSESRVVHRGPGLLAWDIDVSSASRFLAFAREIRRRSINVVPDRKWTRVPRDEVNSASSRRRNRRKTSQSRAKTRKHSLTSARSIYRARALKEQQTPSRSPAKRAKRAASLRRVFFVFNTICCNVTIHAKETLRNVFRTKR